VLTPVEHFETIARPSPRLRLQLRLARRRLGSPISWPEGRADQWRAARGRGAGRPPRLAMLRLDRPTTRRFGSAVITVLAASLAIACGSTATTLPP